MSRSLNEIASALKEAKEEIERTVADEQLTESNIDSEANKPKYCRPNCVHARGKLPPCNKKP